MRGTVYNATAPTLGDGAQQRDARVDVNGRLLMAGDENAATAALVTHAAASAGVNGADQTNLNRRGVQVGVNITTITGTAPTLTVTVQGKDAASGTYYTLLASAALTATGFTLLTVYPGALTTANVSTPQPLPLTWRVITTIGGTGPAVTATIGANLIV